MFMLRKLCVVIWVLAISLTAVAQEDGRNSTKTKAEKEVIAFLDALTSAGLKRDVTTLARFYTDDYFHTNPDGSLMTKAQVLESYKEAPKGVIESSQHDEDRVWIHGNVAFVNTRVTIKGRFNDEPYVRQWRVTYLFEKLKGRWRAVTSHATLILQSSK